MSLVLKPRINKERENIYKKGKDKAQSLKLYALVAMCKETELLKARCSFYRQAQQASQSGITLTWSFIEAKTAGFTGLHIDVTIH